MVIIVPFVHNWKALNIFRSVEERAEKNALCEINVEPKCFVLCFLEKLYYFKKVAIDNYYAYGIDKRAKIRGILGIICMGICGRTLEPCRGESMRTLWIFTGSYVFDCQYYF